MNSADDEILNHIKSVELLILKDFIKICDDNDIDYFLFFGTEIGAVRHHGFIPWDDDVDVIMHRADYERFIDVAKEELDERFFLQTLGTDKDFYHAITRIRANNTTAIICDEWEEQFPYHQGVFFDIFPIDSVPDNKWVMKLHRFCIKLLNSIARSSVVNLKLDKKYSLLHRVSFRFFRVITLFIKPLKIAKLRDRLAQKYNNINTKRIGLISQLYGFENAIWDRKLFEETIEVPFEYLMITVPKEYDSVLTKIYGDWRTPMRVDDIDNNSFMHSGTFFDTEKSYEYYLPEYEKYKNIPNNL